jgi:hypothetical protein
MKALSCSTRKPAKRFNFALEALDHPSRAVRLAADWALNEIEAFPEKNTERP